MHHEDIKAALRKKGVTLADLAKHMGVSPQTVSVVIRGNGSSEAVAKAIAKIVEIPVDVLWPNKYRTAGKAEAQRADRVASLLKSVPRRQGAAA